jgi:hypothetical protein
MYRRGGQESNKRFLLGVGLIGGVASLLVEAFYNLALLLVPSPKICNHHQNNMRKLLESSEFEVLEAVKGESLPSSPF